MPALARRLSTERRCNRPLPTLVPPERLSFRDLQMMGRRLHAAPDRAEVEARLADAVRRTGFSAFLLSCRVDGRWEHLSDLPVVDVVDLIAPGMAEQFAGICQQHANPFRLDARGLGVPAAADGGWLIPFHAPDGPEDATDGWCLLLAPPWGLPAAGARAAIQYLAFHAFEATRRLAAARGRAAGEARLTKRQIECMILAARGKSDWITGTLLGLSPATVHKYLEQAKARYGVSSRTELVVRALYDGQISFGDLIDR